MKFLEKIKTLARVGDGNPATTDIKSIIDGTISSPSDSLSYSADKPVESKDEDRFNRWPFSKRIADTLAGRTDPSSVVIGLYGAWGEGKTSTLRMMEGALGQHTQVICIRFNPWYFDTEEKLLRGFFNTLATSLGRSLPNLKEEIGRLLKDYGSLLSWASAGLGGSAVKDLGQSLSTVGLDKLRERLEKMLVDSKKRLVILVDDIDRLDRREIQAIFKLVKLSADFRYTSYVLSFDHDMVAAALGEKYGEGGSQSGRNFLEKIVQVPLHLPQADQLALRQLTFSGVDEGLRLAEIKLSQPQVDAFIRHFVDGLEIQLKTPRLAKLYANALMFALPILKDEVNPLDQMLIEGIRIFYPKLYTLIRDNRDYFLPSYNSERIEETEKQKVQDAIQTSLENLSHADRENVVRRLLLPLFPRLSTFVGGMNYGPDWEKGWEEAQKVCSREYFSRYFSYAISDRDVSDRFVKEFLEQLKTSQDSAEKQFAAVSTRGATSRLIQKLRKQEDTMAVSDAKALAKILARNGGHVPRERGMLMSDMTFRQAAILIMKLVRCIPQGDEREVFATDLVAEAEPLPFAIQCYRWLRKTDEDPEDQRVVSPECEEALVRLLVERIRISARTEPLYKKYAADTPMLLWIWGKGALEGEIADHLESRLEQGAEEVDQFLDVFVGEAWGVESGLPHKADFDRGDYDNVSKAIGPEFVASKLRARYGTELDAPQYYMPEETPTAKRIAHQFCSIHKNVTSAAKHADQTGKPA
jgi:hypothetical protein